MQFTRTFFALFIMLFPTIFPTPNIAATSSRLTTIAFKRIVERHTHSTDWNFDFINCDAT
jgi:hypothetical protein